MHKSIIFSVKLAKNIFLDWLYRQQIDISITLILGIIFAFKTYLNALQVPDPLVSDFYAQDVWFGSDIPTVFGNMTSFQSDFGRNNKHPLFPIIAFPLVFCFIKVLKLEPILATRLVTALIAGLWIGSLFILFRLIRCPRLDATVFSLLGGVSAAAVFWFVVPESFSFGSLTILLGLVLVAMTQHQRLSPIWYIVVSALTVSITITNWMVGLLVTAINFHWKKALQITGITFLVVNLLWVLQRIVFSNSGYPFSLKTFVGEKKFMSAPESDSVLGAISSFAYKTIVMPAIQISDSAIRPGWPKLSANPLALGSGGFWGTLAILLWTALLALGLWGFFSTKKHLKLRIVLGLTILGQLLIHSVYGTNETFIYSLHFAPLLITLAAFSTLTRWRLVSLVLASLLVLSAGINNRSQFGQLTAALVNYGTPQQQVQAQMRLRPADPWSRSVGHVVLATPGSRAEDKAYYEPGGSFSPVAGSFGVSIWVVDQNHKLKATSDSIPLNQIQQQFVYTAGKNTPGISTKTEYYQANWSTAKPGIWQLNLKSLTSSNAKLAIAIRSVGPAGGAVNKLNWDGQRLLINDRWSVKVSSNLAGVYLGSESSPNWIAEKPTLSQWDDPKGWGYTRLELAGGDSWNMEIEDLNLTPKLDLNADKIVSNPVLELPDPQFVDSFNAQISHLMMGLTGNRTRPGDPIASSLPRLRDGAYEMVALARAGQLDVAKQLSTYFAETDFTDVTQSEADIPALGIWALAVVAEQVNQPEYDQMLWPHVRRKAELLLDMLSTNRSSYPVVEKSKVPFSEHPDFVSVDLVAGKMDALPGLVSIDPAANFMTYRALLDAAVLAERVQQLTDAARWRSQAAQLQTAWQETFDATFAGMDATYTNGLWPSWIASTTQNAFIKGLQSRWNTVYDDRGKLHQPPENTNFNLAETHQWLLLNQPERVWATLRWFWGHQASPGLYTWWSKNDDSNGTRIPISLSHWHRFRGWVNPPHVTPHYWTAAEMLLLQLDMLAYVNPTDNSPILIIGAGIPKQWLNKTLNVKGLLVGGSLVNWTWDGKQVNVEIRGKKMNVQTGGAFPTNTPVNVVML